MQSRCAASPSSLVGLPPAGRAAAAHRQLGRPRQQSRHGAAAATLPGPSPGPQAQAARPRRPGPAAAASHRLISSSGTPSQSQAWSFLPVTRLERPGPLMHRAVTAAALQCGHGYGAARGPAAPRTEPQPRLGAWGTGGDRDRDRRWPSRRS